MIIEYLTAHVFKHGIPFMLMTDGTRPILNRPRVTEGVFIAVLTAALTTWASVKVMESEVGHLKEADAQLRVDTERRISDLHQDVRELAQMIREHDLRDRREEDQHTHKS